MKRTHESVAAYGAPTRVTVALAAVALAAGTALFGAGNPAQAQDESESMDPLGYETIFDGTEETFEKWEYAGDGGFELNDDGTMTSLVGDEGGFGTLWYAEEMYTDFSLIVEWRDDAPEGEFSNSGVQVRFPRLDEEHEECPTTFNGDETGNLSWIAVNCGHEIQINDSIEGDERKTGSLYGFQDLDLEQAQPIEKGEWNTMEIRVVGEDYTVIRNGEVINEYENVHGVYMEGRPNDPPSEARGLEGFVGMQAHGADIDITTFRDIRVRDLSPETTVCERLQGQETFPDVDGVGLRPYIDCLAAVGVVEGYEDGNFGPANDVTREQLASFVVRAIETAADVELPVGDASYPDVGPNSTHGQNVLKLTEAGILQGYDDGTFGPRDSVSREQTAAYVAGAVGLLLGEELATEGGAPFDDVNAGATHAANIDRLSTADVVDGFDDDTFGPEDDVSRAQMSKFVANALELVAEEQLYLGP